MRYNRLGQTGLFVSRPRATGRSNSFALPGTGGDKGFAVVDALREVAEAHGRPVAQVALAWLLTQPQVSGVIVGAKKPEQLADNLAAVDIVLTAAELAALDTASTLSPEYPGWMFERQGAYRRGLLNPAPRG